MAPRRDNTVFLQDVLSNALIAVLALATVSMIQIAIGGMERHVQAATGPDLYAENSTAPPQPGDPRWRVRIPPSAKHLWIIVELPTNVATAELHKTQGVEAGPPPRNSLPGNPSEKRRQQVWSFDLESPPVTDEAWTLDLTEPLPPGESARITVVADDRVYTDEEEGLMVQEGSHLLRLVRPLRGPLRLERREP